VYAKPRSLQYDPRGEREYRMKLRALASLLIIALAGVRAAPAQTVNWTTDLSGNWANGSNWSTGALPGPASNVVIDRGAANPVVTLSSGNITVNTLNTSEAFVLRAGTFPEPLLTLNGLSRFGSTLDSLCCFLNSSSTIDIVGRWTIHFLRLSGAGTTTAAGGIDINASGQFFIEGGHTVVNSGTARIVGTSLGLPVITFVNGGTFRNLAGGVFDFQASGERSDITVLGGTGSNRFDNHGTIRVSGSGGGTIGVPLISTGLIDVQAGLFNGSGTISGEVRAAPGTLVGLGFSTLTSASIVDAAGARVFLAGVNPALRATVAGTLTAGELNLDGTVVLGGRISATRVNVLTRSTGGRVYECRPQDRPRSHR
jgi:hypothetical protein